MKREILDKLIRESGMIHKKLYQETADTYETYLQRALVSDTSLLWDGEDTALWKLLGGGVLHFTNRKSVILQTRARSDCWPEGYPDDGRYCDYGIQNAQLTIPIGDLREYNRIRFEVKPVCRGMHSPMLVLQLYNEGKEKIPDSYRREGFHTLYPENNRWNDCIWEIPWMPRDHVTALSFLVFMNGMEVSMDDDMSFEIRNIRAECAFPVNHAEGWEPDPGQISYSTAGYWIDGKKLAITSTGTDSFSVIDDKTGRVCYSGEPVKQVNDKGVFFVWDFSTIKEPGSYYLEADGLRSETFPVLAHPLYEALWKSVNFLYCERCGYPVNGGHGACHSDVIAKHKGLLKVMNGGWHDAGDVSQQTLQTAEVVFSLMETAQAVKPYEYDLYSRLMEEAVWGLDFVLRMRFGDGYRVSSSLIRRWTDGLIGNFDDCIARVHNDPYENFTISGVEAFAAIQLKGYDDMLSHKCAVVAKEDFLFGTEIFEKDGIKLPESDEHSYNAGASQHYAAAAWSASMIFEATGDQDFSRYAVYYIEKMISCQELKNRNTPIGGFFYRSEEHKQIVHFNHQARFQIFAQALEGVLKTQKEHPDRKKWSKSLSAYGEYICNITKYNKPYGMIPSGLHRMDEYLDKETFNRMHLCTTYEEDWQNYKAQLEEGYQIDKEYCIRMFPIWFSFRGNTAVHLSYGKAAAIIGRYFNNKELIDIARDQFYWIFGRNPFCQSLMYGVGHRYPQQYGALNGQMAGSIIVGIETRKNADVPFLPMDNNATYKEVWTTSTGKFLSLAAELY